MRMPDTASTTNQDKVNLYLALTRHPNESNDADNVLQARVLSGDRETVMSGLLRHSALPA